MPSIEMPSGPSGNNENEAFEFHELLDPTVLEDQNFQSRFGLSSNVSGDREADEGTPQLQQTESALDAKNSKCAKGRANRFDWESLTLDTWFGESIAMSFSFLCFIAIVAVLWVYDKKPNPNLKYGLTLNTIVSVLGTGCKSSLIFAVAEAIGQLKWVWFRNKRSRLHDMQSFDDASRGPLGSMMILFEHKAFSLVSLGAAITLLSLAFDPFIQQIVSYPIRETKSVSDQAPAKQARAFVLNGPSGDDINFVNSINAGIWTNNFDVYPTCPSGNCTWPAFDSVGWCSQCEDVTSKATLVGCDDFNLTRSDPHLGVTPCNLTLPHGEPANFNISVRSVSRGSLQMTFPEDVIWSVNYNPELGDPFSPVPTEVYLGVENPMFVVAHAEIDDPDNGSNPKIGRVTECILSLCTRTYHVSVSRGVPSVNTSSPTYGHPFYHIYLNGPESANYTGTPETCWKRDPGPVNVELVAGDPRDDTSHWENATEFAFCGLEHIHNNFPYQITGYAYYSRDYVSEIGAWITDYYDSTRNDNFQRVLDTSLANVMGNIAGSLTKLSLESGNDTVPGTVSRFEVYVAVDWTWIILPAGLLLSAIIFLVSTIFLNRRFKLDLWKSSILAPLYHGLDDDLLAGDNNEHPTASQMSRSANAVDVKLQFSDAKKRLLLQTE
ncbi:DUF3176 domain-containing protein [Aspergillus thermomutatus]|uniref:Uncharacterized protein n=1 Tax=Aspergillus thermomutatus TaxID=41047 RepID=A0A397GE43_ASPTH|nr:uncharacterized protein CDV56_105145 [Aspergillus thermomutatus]RHZ47233.1 hypothetical protein CDV56_105145 [Aspergillus thermomutatus]